MIAKEKVSRAIDAIYDQHPYLASIVASWKIVAAPQPDTSFHMYETIMDKAGCISLPGPATCATCGQGPKHPNHFTGSTDGPTMRYNPAFIDWLNIAETIDFVLHESGHIFLGHHVRLAEIIAQAGGNAAVTPQMLQLWNIAADLALNYSILSHIQHDGKIKQFGCFPGEGQFRDLPVGKDAEFYYAELRKKIKEEQQKEDGKGQPQQGQGQPQDGSSSGSGKGQGKGEPSFNRGPKSVDDEDPDAEGNGDGGDGDAEGDSEGTDGQGGGNGQPQPKQGKGEARNGLPNSMGEVETVPDAEDAEGIEDATREWEQTVARGINDAKSCGKLPGWMQTLGEKLYGHKSSTDWKLYLRRFLTRYAPVRLTYKRINRRFFNSPKVILPTRHSLEASDGEVLVDTSGSMSNEECDLALAEISNIAVNLPGSQITLRQCDTRLVDEDNKKTFSKWDFPLKRPQTWSGRGGTDLSPAINAIAKERKAKWIIVVSDMEWNYAATPDPRIPVMWLITHRGQAAIAQRGQPKFGIVVGPVEAPVATGAKR